MTEKPFIDIAERIKWHRNQVGKTQFEYAQSISVQRNVLANWERGIQRVGLDGALSLRRKYGLSLDFIYEGIADALPMSLRNAWLDNPSDKS